MNAAPTKFHTSIRSIEASGGLRYAAALHCALPSLS